MSEPGTDEADATLSLLARALSAAEPVPERVLEGARAAFTWRTIDTELAELVFDSERDEAGVRAADVNRQMTFQAPGVEIEIMVIDTGARRLVGQLVPPAEMTVELIAGGDTRTMTCDDLGRFAFDGLAPGPVRVRPMARTTSRPSETSPKIECRSSRWGVGASVMKNWPPLVFGPRLAIDRRPALSWRSRRLNSSGKM
jgi:hypothetical protein